MPPQPLPRKHARTHLPDGTDPIPGLGQLAWIRRSKSLMSTPEGVGDSAIKTVNTWTATDSSGADGLLSASGDGIGVQKAGVYAITAEIQWDTVFDDDFLMGIDDGNVVHWFPQWLQNSIGQTTAIPTYIHRLDAMQIVELVLYQRTGASKDIQGAYLEVVKLGSFAGNSAYAGNPDW